MVNTDRLRATQEPQNDMEVDADTTEPAVSRPPHRRGTRGHSRGHGVRYERREIDRGSGWALVAWQSIDPTDAP